MAEGRDAPRRAIDVPGGSIALDRGDITLFEGDAIVNAANPGLMGGGGVDGAIHRAAGPRLDAECSGIVSRIGRLAAGKAVVTTGGDLPARLVVHTLGPVWHGGGRGEAETLASAYRESVRAARENGARTVAFPSVSTGVYGYPVRAAAPVALRAVRDALAEAVGERDVPIAVTFMLFDDTTHAAYAEALETLREA